MTDADKETWWDFVNAYQAEPTTFVWWGPLLVRLDGQGDVRVVKFV